MRAPWRRPGLDRHCYLAYAEHGVFVIQADDRLSAILADAPSASEFDVPISSPLLAVKRIAYALDRRPVELRFSMFALVGASYCCSIGQEARP